MWDFLSAQKSMILFEITHDSGNNARNWTIRRSADVYEVIHIIVIIGHSLSK